MLLNFTAKNYKSFADEMNFSMIAAPKQNDLSYSLFKGKTGGQNYKVQCSSVVYGANASGKSNIISAMDTFKAIILRGHIKNDETPTLNVAAAKIELVPNINNTDSVPVEFEIEFIDGSLWFKYSLSFDIGMFLDNDYHRKVICEQLYLNNKLVFKRSGNVELGEYKYIQKYLNIQQEEFGRVEKIVNSSLNDEELFLTNGFKVIISPELAKIFTNWISKKLIVIYRADIVESGSKPFATNKQKVYVEKTINDAIKLFGAYSNKLGHFYGDENDDIDVLCSIIKTKGSDRPRLLPAECFESYGTVRFANMFPLVKDAFLTGATLVIDEFDASIHPSALMNIINMFHNNSINKNHAQLIFNTHNPIFLNSNLFRRDEIKFVQRDHDTGNSEVYSLADFGTSGKNGVRNSTDYMKYYLDYSYGAIEDVDFTPIFENIINNDNSENSGGA